MMNQLELSDMMSDKTFEAIREYTHQTAFNTEFGLWDGVAIAISLFSLIFAGATLYSQWKTEQNTRRLTIELQKKLLIDMIRHLYRNMVVTYTMKHKLEACGYEYYPSEEHLVKLKIPMENIHLDIFYYKDDDYMKMYELYLKFRNYNEEIDLACRHLCSGDVDRLVKERDMATLLFKPGFLTSGIVAVLKAISDGSDNVNYDDKARMTIKNAHDANVARNGRCAEPDSYVRYEIEDDYIKTLYKDTSEEFFNMLNLDTAIECGNNNQNSPKIFMIKIKK